LINCNHYVIILLIHLLITYVSRLRTLSDFTSRCIDSFAPTICRHSAPQDEVKLGGYGVKKAWLKLQPASRPDLMFYYSF